MTQAETLSREITGIAAIITAARGMVSDGKAVNLQPLEAEMRRLCAAVERVPRTDARLLEPRLLALIDELDKLFAAISSQHAELKQQLGDVALRGRAVNAYASRSKKSG
ncbi:MAG: hypothetical protein ACM30I_06760 [Gemmatimonas sp.]